MSATTASPTSASPAGAPVRHYDYPHMLQQLTSELTSALEEAVTRAEKAMDDKQREGLTPLYYVEATRAALRHVLDKRFAEGVVSEQMRSLSSNPAPTPEGSPSPQQSQSQDGQSNGTGEEKDKKKKKITRAYIDGCYDIMHSGHYNAIRQAKALADVLVVGVHSDAEIRKHKGPPVMNDEERVAAVQACKWVDEVVFDTPYDPSLELLLRLNCDFCVHGDDISTNAQGVDAFAEVKAAGRMKIVKRTEGVSTTDLVGRMLSRTKKEGGDKNKAASSSGGNGHSDEDADGADNDKPISNFLPTTWRLSQFSNHRTPKSSDKVVYLCGSFDLFHAGHIDTLKAAKALGNFLYVGVHDDATVSSLHGGQAPIMTLHERVMNLLACRFVDEVVIGAPHHVTRDLITSLNINIVCAPAATKEQAEEQEKAQEKEKAKAKAKEKSNSESSKRDSNSPPVDSKDPYAIPRLLDIFRVLESSAQALSTEAVVQRLVERRGEYEARNAKRAPRESAYLSGQKQFVAEI